MKAAYRLEVAVLIETSKVEVNTKVLQVAVEITRLMVAAGLIVGRLEVAAATVVVVAATVVVQVMVAVERIAGRLEAGAVTVAVAAVPVKAVGGTMLAKPPTPITPRRKTADPSFST